MQAPSDSPSPMRGSRHPAAARRIIFGVMLAMFLSALDQTIVATALPAIGRDLGRLEDLSWVITAYLLSATTVTPLYGKVADIYGRRPALVLGIGIFMIGSIGCALAATMPHLIVARGIQGLGGGCLIALGQTIVADTVTPIERAAYQAHFGVLFAAANVLGAVLGGVSAQYLHWSLVFWINLPLGALALFVAYRALAGLPQHYSAHRLDFLGAGLIASATVTLLLVLTWGGARYPWTSSTVVALGCASACLWVLFALRTAFAREPFLPVSLLGNSVVRNATAAAFFGMGTLIGLSIYVPVYLQMVRGLSLSQAGLGLIPLLGFSIVGATLSGRQMARTRHYKRLPSIGLAAGSAALLVMAVAHDGSPLALVILLLMTAGVGMGSLFPVTTVSLQNAVRPHVLGTATAAMNFARQLGGTILVALFGAMLLWRAGLSGGRSRGIEVAQLSHADTDAVVEAFRWIFGAASAALATGLVFLLLMKALPLRQSHSEQKPEKSL